MKTKLLKIILPIIGIGIVSSSVVSLTSCSQNGLSPATISKIMQVLKKESVAEVIPSLGEDNVFYIENPIGDFAPHTPNDTDIQHWNDSDTDSKVYKDAVADAVAWSDQITAPMKTYIDNKVKAGGTWLNESDDEIKEIEGYASFREQYFTVHLANIRARSRTTTNLGWIFSSEHSTKQFTCLQTSEDNKSWKDDDKFPGSPVQDGVQNPSYLSVDNRAYYQEMNLPHLWSEELWNEDKTCKFIPYIASGDAVVEVSYLVTFSPKPWTEEAPPVAFYIYANLECTRIGG